MNKTFFLVENPTNNTEIVNANRQLVLSETDNAPKTRKPRAKDMWYYTGKARATFNRQFAKSNDLKWAILESVVAFNCQDQERFWLDYSVPVKKLLDSRRFEAECNALGLDSGILATHIVFLGKKAVNDVLDYGVGVTVGEKVSLYKDAFLAKEIMELMTSQDIRTMSMKQSM